MHRANRLALQVLVLATGGSVRGDDSAAIPPARPIALFSGKSLDGWYTFRKETGRRDPNGAYSVRDGAIRISGEGAGYLATERACWKYHLSLELK